MIGRVMITLLLLLLLTSCLKTEVLNAPLSPSPPAEKRHKGFPKDTTERQDTARVPIEFDASVEDWNKTNVDL